MRFPAKKNAGCPKVQRDFPPRKDGILYPPSGCLGTPFPSPRVYAGGQAYADVTTKRSRIDRLPNLLSSMPLEKRCLNIFIFLSLNYVSSVPFRSRKSR